MATAAADAAAVVVFIATNAASPPEIARIIQRESAINAHIKFRLNNNQGN